MRQHRFLLLFVLSLSLLLTSGQAVGRSRRYLGEVHTGWALPVRALAMGPKGLLLAAGGDSKQVVLYNLKGRRTLWLSSTGGPVAALAFSPDGKVLAIAWRSFWVHLVSVTTGRLLRRVGPLKGYPQSLAFSPDGKLLAVAGQAQQISLFDPTTGKLSGRLTGHTSWVNQISFSDDGRLLASAGWDHAVRLWEVGRRKLLRSIRRHRYAVNATLFSSKGDFVISASDDQHLRRSRVSDGASLSDRRSPAVICMARASGSNRVVGGTFRGRLLFFDTRLTPPFEVIAAHRGQIFAVAAGPGGRLVVSGGRDGKIKLWRGR